jgi:D-tyrosyl-tRNA(Tyr) deacylase
MRALLQRVSGAHVDADGRTVGRIERGLVVLLGVGRGDGLNEVRFLAEKTVNVRIFEDEAGKMNRSVLEIGGGVLVVSQFTLYADTTRGRRPGFEPAAPPEVANDLYEAFLDEVARRGATTAHGAFGAKMQVHLVNDGPVTILLEKEPGQST